MWYEEDVIIAAAAYIIINERKKRKRSCWMRPSLKKRNDREETRAEADPRLDHHLAIAHLQSALGMSSLDFDDLVNKIGPIISRQDTILRLAISVKERLLVTLRFLATGDSYNSMMQLFNISKQAISAMIPEVCAALAMKLQHEIKLPTKEEQWQDIASEFYSRWKFPHCAGVVDGRHITLQTSRHCVSENFDKKIVIFGLVNANYQFMYFNVEFQSRISEDEAFNSTNFNKNLMDRTLNLPDPTTLIGREKLVPYVFLGNSAFTRIPNLLKPYFGAQEKGSPKSVFNYRLSRVQRVSENVFGIISAKFGVFQKTLLLEHEKIKKIVCACIYLHNYLRGSPNSRRYYTPEGSFDSEDKKTGEVILGSWRKGFSKLNISLKETAPESYTEVSNTRQEFTEFFQTAEGSITWQ
ncbi:uncharacterized protein LOC143922195 [Arctopsyche grandis]|uniref:uncharacterized protein LOC143920793 n=1 Tax=Arctopsyche grandis TaxID=121162 RepID=UPI00406D81E0